MIGCEAGKNEGFAVPDMHPPDYSYGQEEEEVVTQSAEKVEEAASIQSSAPQRRFYSMYFVVQY